MIAEQAAHTDAPDQGRVRQMRHYVLAPQQPFSQGHKKGDGECHGRQLQGRDLACGSRKQG